ncbi:LacI family transcriptional regulator, partial [Rhizobium johnstonii]
VGFDDGVEGQLAGHTFVAVAGDPKGIGRRAAQRRLKQINVGEAEAETGTTAGRLVGRESGGAGMRGKIKQDVAECQ